MPQKCPHCGIALPAVVDAFCPECREDLSETPESLAYVPPPAPLPVVGPVSKDLRYLANTNTVARWTLTALIVSGVSAIMLIVGLISSDWELALVAVFLLVLSAGWVVVWFRVAADKTSVSSQGRTSKDSEQPK